MKERKERTHVTNVLVTVVGVAVVIVGAYFSRDYVRRVLLWVAGQQAWVVVLVFLALFTLVSMPLMWGYIVVNISAGYMFGTWRGLAVTVTTATAGVFVAHMLIRVCLRERTMTCGGLGDFHLPQTPRRRESAPAGRWVESGVLAMMVVVVKDIVHRRVVTSRLLRALLSVLGGAQAFKVIAITRLTPIPFGLQNAVFAVSVLYLLCS
ncbi:Transmembrane protein 64 [Portunus trituberculatus]|uniref:Transmembrane protein 64 n=1 Tax=Portunus trituberculatus TaxID=210409 RepID=A0A5B7F6Y2_PORTR|nr:Transmembrane protein 64 [Portunus trituberculatus]